MSSPSSPLVSVVTPFYNTAPYLRQCIESVLRQDYTAWEYILVDNRSTDGSAEIAREFAAREPRIRLLQTDMFLSQVDNYNFSLRQISEASAYCKIVQADDWLFADCLSRMVELAEAQRSVGYVTSYFLEGTAISGGPLPPDETVHCGRDAATRDLRSGTALLASPTTVMYRASIVRACEEFFDTRCLHEDTDALFRILERWDLGFVHALLSFCRADNESITGAVRPHGPYELDRFLRSRLYADRFLGEIEGESVRARAERDYLEYLAARLLGGAGTDFWAYHRRGWRTVDYRLPAARFAVAVLWELADTIGNPKRTAGRLLARWKPRSVRATES
jgi:glycosyltransferase involved in cell wall biosynthesis